MSLAERIQQRLEATGLNPYSAAKSAGLGGDYVRDIMRGRVKEPSAKRLAALAGALDTTPKFLLGYANTDPEPSADIGIRTGLVRLRFDRDVTPAVAAKILALLEEQ